MMTMMTTTTATILPSSTIVLLLPVVVSTHLRGAFAFPRQRRQQSTSASMMGDMMIDDGVPCLTADECRARYDALISSSVIDGNFYSDADNNDDFGPYEGCVLKGDNVYFGNGGTIEQMSSILYGEKQRLWCDETMMMSSSSSSLGANDAMHHTSMGMSNTSMIRNETSASMMGGGMESMSPSGTNQMGTTMMTAGPPSVAPVAATADVATTCEIGSSANTSKSCPDDEFCQLRFGACNVKMTVYVGSCVAVPQVCTLDYNPVCGCDQITYANECMSYSSGISVSRTGECDVGNGTTDNASTTNDTATSAIENAIDDVVNATDAIADAVTDCIDNATIPALGNYTDDEDDGDTKMESTTSSSSSSGTAVASYAPGLVVAIVPIIILSAVVHGGENWL